MAKSKLSKANKKIEDGVVSTYKKIEHGVVSSYKKIEEGAVDGFNNIANKFLDNFLTKKGESVEDAKARIAKEHKERENNATQTIKKYSEQQDEIIEKSFKNTQNTVLESRRKSDLE